MHIIPQIDWEIMVILMILLYPKIKLVINKLQQVTKLTADYFQLHHCQGLPVFTYAHFGEDVSLHAGHCPCCALCLLAGAAASRHANVFKRRAQLKYTSHCGVQLLSLKSCPGKYIRGCE